MFDLKSFDAVAEVLQGNSALITEQVTQPPRAARYAALPEGLPVRLAKRIEVLFPQGLYSHQTKTIQLGMQGANVCIATPTASGKTIAFATIVLNRLASQVDATAIVMYPAKALVADQMEKWTNLASNLGLRVSVIDGSVNTRLRAQLLSESDIVLMTPDVVHAWLLARCDEAANSTFLDKLDIAVLDEAHTYEGVFGTNMMFMIRRLRAASNLQQIIASTATISDAANFLLKLTGLEFEIVGAESDGAIATQKTFLHCAVSPRKLPKTVRDLVVHLSSHAVREGKFIAFVDSRKQVEELVAMAQGVANNEGEEAGVEGDNSISQFDPELATVLPYRAGYEEEDRKRIQDSLSTGQLAGVIATSALELGIDIGEVSTVLLVGVPGTMKSFWQRAGRAGRRGDGRVIVLDSDNTIRAGGLAQFLQRPSESNWLYVENEYLQFANALCAAEELASRKHYSRAPFSDLPASFAALLENEVRPTAPLPSDLYPLKQQAGAASKPQLAFPVRTGIERQYKVVVPKLAGASIGTMSYSQVLREAFPGAIYRYMAKPYRVFSIKHGTGEIQAGPMKGNGRTAATSRAMAFPSYPAGTYVTLASQEGFLLETKMQVSERVVGFSEIWGNKRETHTYEIGSTYAQKPLTRHFETTGVCLNFGQLEYNKEVCARYLMRAFCRVCSVHERDIGSGLFRATIHPLGSEPVTGMAIYDANEGSLRLTRQYLSKLTEIFDEAMQLAQVDEAQATVRTLELLASRAAACSVRDARDVPTISVLTGRWINVVAAGQKALLHDGVTHVGEEVVVERFAYTPQGPVYFLRPSVPGASWRVAAGLVRPIPGESAVYEYDIETGDTRAGPKPA